MSPKPLDSLNRVKAACAQFNDSGKESGAYHVYDIKSVLRLVDRQKEMLDCISDDLSDLLLMAPGLNRDDMAKLIESTMKLLEDK